MRRASHSKKRPEAHPGKQADATAAPVDADAATPSEAAKAHSSSPAPASASAGEKTKTPPETSALKGANEETALLTRRKHYRTLREEVGWALVFTVVLLGANLLLEKTEIGARLQLMTYDAMQNRLGAALGKKPLPVAIIDITQEPGTLGDQLTPRKPLAELIERLSKLKKHPRAIGLDIDCSPESAGDKGAPAVLTDEEQEFYDFCLQLSKRPTDPIPVFLGADRTATGPSADWLWQKEYADLAVALKTPSDDRHTMWAWIDVTGGDRPLRSISAALAESSHIAAARTLPSWLRWAAEAEQEQDPASGIKVQRFLVDYSALERLASEKIPEDQIRSGQTANLDLSEKVVLIGNGSDATSDKLPVPDRNRAYPGVLIHGCAVCTLLKSPLYELTTTGRIAADLCLALVILGVVTGVKLWKVRTDQPDPLNEKRHAVHHSMTWLVILGTFVGGVIFVHKTRVMWDDFPLVVIGLLYHHPVEAALDGLVHRLRKHKPEEDADSAPQTTANAGEDRE